MILLAQVFDAPNWRMSGRKVADDALRKRMVSGYSEKYYLERRLLMAVSAAVIKMIFCERYFCAVCGRSLFALLTLLLLRVVSTFISSETITNADSSFPNKS